MINYQMCWNTLGGLVLTVLAAGAIADSSTSPMHTLHVRGEAQLMVSPDQAAVVLGVTTESSTAKKAMSANNKKMRAITQSLKSLGVKEKDYKTQNFRVQPVWSPRPRNAKSDWKSTIVAYRVNNSLRVTTQELDVVGDMIGAATAAGANQVNSIHFSLSNERQYRSQAIRQAMANAKEDAQTLANASGDNIKRTISLHLGDASASKVRVQAEMAKSRLMSDQASFSSPPISSGEITVRASVSVVYELE